MLHRCLVFNFISCTYYTILILIKITFGPHLPGFATEGPIIFLKNCYKDYFNYFCMPHYSTTSPGAAWHYHRRLQLLQLRSGSLPMPTSVQRKFHISNSDLTPFALLFYILFLSAISSTIQSHHRRSSPIQRRMPLSSHTRIVPYLSMQTCRLHTKLISVKSLT